MNRRRTRAHVTLALASTILLAACAPTAGMAPSTATAPGADAAQPDRVVVPQRPLDTAGGKATITGRVPAGARVDVSSAVFEARPAVGADGGFSLEVPAGNYYVVTASQEGANGKLESVAVLADAAKATVDLGTLTPLPTGSLRGMVALAGGGDPAGADVFVPGTHLMGKVGVGGQFALANLPEGHWTIVIQKPGYQRVALDSLTVAPGAPTRLTSLVTLPKGDAVASGLKGLAQDAKGKALVGAQLTAVDAKGKTYGTTADAKGNVTLAGLPAGTYTLALFHPFVAAGATRSVTVAEGAVLDAGNLALAGEATVTGTIAGVVTDEEGNPVAGARVQLDPPAAEPVTADGSGRFSFAGVAGGEYTVSASSDGFADAARGVVLKGADAKVEKGLVLRAAVAAAPKAGRKVAELLAPEVTIEREGADLTVKWAAVGLPEGVTGVDYQLEGEVLEGGFVYLGHTTETQLTLKDYGDGPARFRLTANPIMAAPAEGYELLQFVGVGGVSSYPVDIRGMDLETAMMAVQANRANVLEDQLKSQIEAVQMKNEQIAKLNQYLGVLNALAAKFPGDAKRGDAIKAEWWKPNPAIEPAKTEVALAAAAAGVTTFAGKPLVDGIRAGTKADLDGAIQTVKSQIDAASSSQQMDMLRLQSLSNKRNEAFEIMTSFVKKMADNRSSIVGNMR